MPLKCRWCSNPESHQINTDYSRNKSRCLLCGKCVESCPQHALVRLDGKIGRDSDKCQLCGTCESKCPNQAVSLIGKKVTVSHVMREVLADDAFYREDGGLTLSGGEALLQPEFSAALSREAQMNGLSTAIESSFAVPFESARMVCRHLDHLMVDVKHMDTRKHREGTGQGNERILENIRKIRSAFPALEMIIRCPIIPGYNDDEENLKSLASFAGSIKNARLELLPYHRLGENKYTNLDREYELTGLKSPTAEHMRRLREIAGEYVEIIWNN